MSFSSYQPDGSDCRSTSDHAPAARSRESLRNSTSTSPRAQPCTPMHSPHTTSTRDTTSEAVMHVCFVVWSASLGNTFHRPHPSGTSASFAPLIIVILLFVFTPDTSSPSQSPSPSSSSFRTQQDPPTSQSSPPSTSWYMYM